MHATTGTTTTHATGKGGVAIAIIRGALLVVVEDIVSLTDLLELVLGSFVVRVFVGVIFHRELAVGLFEIVRSRVSGNAEDLVVVALVSHE